MTFQTSRTVRLTKLWSSVGILAMLLPILPASPVGAGEGMPDRSGVIIRIAGEITPTTLESLRRRIDDARTLNAQVLIFELNTQGGRLDSAIEICDLIKNQGDVTTVAWINTTAHSAGALIAVACDEIVMARSSRIGDSQAILGGPLGVMPIPEELQPKMLTPLLHEFETSAQLHGYSPALSEAFVRPELVVWWLENVNTGERKFISVEVSREEKDTETDEEKSAEAGEEEGAATGAEGKETREREVQPAAPVDDEWKLVETYFDEIIGAKTKVLQPIVRNDRLLQMSAGQAIAYGFCKGIVVDENNLTAHYGLSSVVRVKPSWSEHLAGWLTSMWVRGFLLVLILLGAYVEFNTPGVGVPGLVALICLAVFIGAPYLTGLANIWEIVVILAGVALIAVEVFAIPGFGVFGIAGITLVALGMLGTFVPDEPNHWLPIYIPRLESTLETLKAALATMASSAVVSFVGMVILSKYLPKVPAIKGLMPANPTPSEVAVDDPYRGHARVGDLGVADSPLMPGGKARFGSLLVDVVTEGEFVEPAIQVEVIERRGNRVVVRAVSQ